MKTLETERLILRPMTIDDIRDVYEFLANEDTAYWFGMPQIFEKWQVCRFIERGEDWQYGITIKGDDKVVGVIQVYDTEEGAPGSKELGYVLSPEARGNGYMKEAVDAVCDYLFSETPTDYVSLQIRADNGPSRSIAAACGFIEDETLSFWQKDTNFYGYHLDDYTKVRETKAVNRLGDFLPLGTRRHLYRTCMAA